MDENGKKLTLGSLFDGIAGFPLAAAGLGIKTVWTSEIEPNCIEIAERHFPEAKQLGDITKLNGADIDPVDIISFGSPCQNLSTAGNQRGLDGEKSQLFFEAVRIVYEMRGKTNGEYPKYIIWENVAGAFSSNKGQDFRRVLEEITKTYIPMPNSRRWAAAGMVRSRGGSTAWRMLDAQYWGVPQRRKRIYLVHSFGNERAGQILFECEGVLRNTAQGRAEGQDASCGTGKSVAAADSGAAGMKRTVFTIAGNAIGRNGKNGGNQLGIGQDVSYTLTAADRHCVAVPEIVKNKYRPECYQKTVGTLCARDYKGVGNEYVQEGKLVVEKAINNGETYGTDRNTKVLYRIRRLTPIEYERLNGFPDEWTKKNTNGGIIADNNRYMALGNSIAVPCAERVFRGIIAAEEAEVAAVAKSEDD